MKSIFGWLDFGKARRSRQRHRLLEALANDPEAWLTGYELTNAAEMKPGSIYNPLAWLEVGGLVTRDLKKRPKGNRWCYQVTAAGLQALKDNRSV